MMGFLQRMFLLPSFIRGDLVAIRVGKGVGITVYGPRDQNLMRRVAVMLFQLTHNLKTEGAKNKCVE